MPESAGGVLRLLAFDFGMRRIGVAFGQNLGGVIRPLPVLAARDGAPDWGEVTALLEQWYPHRLLVGLPCHADGRPHPVARGARRFGNRLHGRFGLPVEWVNEQLSSLEAQRRLEQLPDRRRQAKIALDSMAAGVILETWLHQQQYDGV